MSEEKVSVRVLHPLFEHWRRHNRPLAELWRIAGVASEPEPDARWPEESVAALCAATVAATEDPSFALQAGASAQPQSLGPLGYVLQNCETVGEAFERLQRHWCWLHSQPLFSLQQKSGTARITLDAKPREQVQPRQALVEYLVGYLLRLSGSLVGGDGRGVAFLQQIHFRFAEPCDAQQAAYAEVFRKAKVLFRQPKTAVLFDAELLRQRVPFADAAVRAAFELRIRATSQGHNESPTVQKVRQLLARCLPGRAPTVQEVAHQLAMSRATLQRRLMSEQSSFVQLLDQYREQLARQWLGGDEYSIGEIAFMLGYADRPAFHNAFKRWTGQTPQSFRSQP